MTDNQQMHPPKISHILFIDIDGTRQVAQADPDLSFDANGAAAIVLAREADGFRVTAKPMQNEPTPDPAPLALTTADPAQTATTINDRLTIEHLSLILTNVVPKISDAFAKLGIPVPSSKDAVNHEAILALLRAAMTKATAEHASSPTSQSDTTRITNADSAMGSILETGPIITLDGMGREELLTGNKKALKALFATLHTRGATAIPEFEAWAKAEGVWPNDGRFTAEIRANVSAMMLKKIEYPVKIATGLHESVPGPDNNWLAA